MFEFMRYTASCVPTGLRFAIIASLILIAGCGGGSGGSPDEKVDFCPVDDTKTEEGLCGCGIPDTDTDNDGTPDCQDACPEDVGTMPDEFGFCGETGASAMVVAGEAITLAVNGAVLSIPADALVPGTIVTLVEVDPTTLDTPPNGVDESLFTPVYSLNFSAAQLVDEKLTFALDVTPPVNARWDAHLKTAGGLATDGQADVDWRIIFGDYVPQQSLLTIKLGATANQYLIAGVSENTATAEGATGVIVETSASPIAMAARVARAEVATGVSVETSASPVAMAARVAAAEVDESNAPPAEWKAHGWVIMCSPSYFAQFNNPRCNPLSRDYTEIMTALGAELYASDQVLTDKGFPVGLMDTISQAALEATKSNYIFYDPDNRSVTTSNISGGPPLYFIAWANPNNTDPVLGSYFPDFETIHVDVGKEGLGPVNGEPFISKGTVIHELMHAVQNHRITNAWDRNWIIEGLASAIEPFAPSYSGPMGTKYRWGSPRNWSYSLDSEVDGHAYEVSEYWLSWDSNLENLPAFYDAIGDVEITKNRQYQEVNGYQLDTGTNTTLRDAYLALIKTRNEEAESLDYEYCVEDESTFFTCSEASCSKTITDVVPMSAQCLYYVVEFPECEGEPAETTVALESGVDNPNLKMMADGVLYDANIEAPFMDLVRIWVINTDFNQVSTPPTAELVFRNKSSCDNVKLLRQQHSAYVNSAITAGVGLGPGMQNWTREEVFSYEDLTQPSYVLIRDEIDTDGVEVPISPLVNDSWGASHSSSVQSEGTAIDYNSSAMASVDAKVSGVFTGLLAAGSFATTAERSASNTGLESFAAASSLYYFKTGNVAVELNLTWDCGLSGLNVSYVNPITFRDTELIISRANPLALNNWECAPKQFIIPPGTLFRVSFASRFNAAQKVNLSNFYESEGGAYEINIINIEE